MKIYCSYHPMRPARWDCPQCGSNFCSDCVRKNSVLEYGVMKEVALCPNCNLYLDQISISNVIDPFWKRLHQLFLYPIHLTTLLFITMISAISSFFITPSLISGVAQLVLAGLILRYSYSVLVKTSHGSLVPPSLDFQLFSGSLAIVFKQFMILAVVTFVVFRIYAFAGSTYAILVASILALALPAIIIILAVSNSLVGALNPLVFVRLIFRIGWGYPLMVFFLSLLGSAPFALRHLISPEFPLQVKALLYSIIGDYYAIVAYHLMGYVMFQYHQEVGYDINYVEEKTSRKAEKSGRDQKLESKVLKEVNIFIKEGNIDKAIDVIRESGEAGSDLILADRYFNLLKLKQRFPEMLSQGKIYLDLLEKTNQKEALCEVYLECLSRDQSFKPSAAALFRIAKALGDAGQAEASLKAYDVFIRENPGHTLVPNALYFSAKISHEKLNDPEKAAKLLKRFLDAYPFHESANLVRQHLNRIQSA